MLPEVNLTSLLPSLLTLVETAGHTLCLFHKQQDIKVFRKTDGSPVTSADRDSHSIIKKGLETLWPSVPVVSEEDSLSWGLRTPLYWLVDPLDGTHEFIRKGTEFCINIALIKNRRPIFGLIHLPITRETYYGYGETAEYYKNGKTIPISARVPPPAGMTLLLGGMKYTRAEEDFLKNYPIAHLQRVKSAIKFCYIASGKADLYLRLEPCAEWDSGAGQALVEAAGGTTVTLDGEPLIYGKENLMNGSFVVFGKQNDCFANR